MAPCFRSIIVFQVPKSIAKFVSSTENALNLKVWEATGRDGLGERRPVEDSANNQRDLYEPVLAALFLRPGKRARDYRYEHDREINHEDVESDRCAYCFLPYEGHVGLICGHSKQTESRQQKSPPATIPAEPSRKN